MLAVVDTGFGRQPFRGSVAVASGRLTAAELRGGRWRRLFHDVYVDASVCDSDRLIAAAALLRAPEGAVLTGRTAANLWGAGLEPPGFVEITSEGRVGVRGIKAHVGSVASSEVVRHHGLPVSTAAHTAWDLARTLRRNDAVAWIDRLSNRCRLANVDLVRHAESHSGDWGSARALAVMRLCDGRAESPPESLIRLTLHDAGVPAPVPQWKVVDAGGYFVARVDFAWPELCLALEYDGQWHADRDQLARDRSRIRKLNAAGWYVYPVTSADLRDMPRFVASIKELIVARSRVVSNGRAI